MNPHHRAPHEGSAAPTDPSRRSVIRLVGAGAAASACCLATPPAWAEATPSAIQKGDRLVAAKGDLTRALRPQDIEIGAKPVLVYALDPLSGKPRDASRLDKLLVVRMNDADVSGDVKARSAGGVLAFSAICTHQACEVTEWNKAERALACFCHGSKFDPLAGGAVVKGPAARGLPWLSLTLEDDVLVVASGLSARAGA